MNCVNHIWIEMEPRAYKGPKASSARVLNGRASTGLVRTFGDKGLIDNVVRVDA